MPVHGPHELAAQGLPRVPWGIREIVAALALALLALAAIRVSVGYVTHDLMLAWVLSAMLLELTLLAIALSLSVGRHRTSLAAFGFRRYARGHRSLPLLGILGMLLSLTAWDALARVSRVPALTPEPNVPLATLSAQVTAVLLATTVCVLAPLAEETFFRGFLFQGLLGVPLHWHVGRFAVRSGGVWPAMSLSSLLFAAAHVQVGLLVPFGLASAVLTGLFWRSGSLWSAILAHAGFNTIALAVALLRS